MGDNPNALINPNRFEIQTSMDLFNAGDQNSGPWPAPYQTNIYYPFAGKAQGITRGGSGLSVQKGYESNQLGKFLMKDSELHKYSSCSMVGYSQGGAGVVTIFQRHRKKCLEKGLSYRLKNRGKSGNRPYVTFNSPLRGTIFGEVCFAIERVIKKYTFGVGAALLEIWEPVCSNLFPGAIFCSISSLICAGLTGMQGRPCKQPKQHGLRSSKVWRATKSIRTRMAGYAHRTGNDKCWSFSRCKPLLAVNYGLGLLFRVPHYLVGWNDGIVEVYGMRLALMKKDKMLDYCGHAQLSSEFRCHAEDMKYPVVSTSCQVRDRLLGGLKDDLIQWVDKSNTKPGMCASNWPSSSFPNAKTY